MADDGMLLNFTVDEQSWTTKPTFKGGSWKDRLTAKKAAQYGQSKGAPVAQRVRSRAIPNFGHVSSEEEYIAPRPAKRQRIDHDHRPSPASSSKRATDGDRLRQEFGRASQGAVVSSLFTYNPSSTTKLPAEKAQEETYVEPSNAPLQTELDTFRSLGLSTTLAAHLLKKLDIKVPTAIQKKAVAQLVKDDSDAFIQAETGSGKTLAYLLPIVQRIMTISETARKEAQGSDAAAAAAALGRNSGLFAIILAPTRELSKQISTVLEGVLGCAHWIVAGTVIGGEKKKSEKARLRKGLNILVATPGRLADHLSNTEVLDVSNVRWLVLDEGDRLMELGFEQDIQRIVSVLNLRMRKAQAATVPGLPEKRTTVLCSATMKMNVQRLGEISLKDAVAIAADPSEQTKQDGDKSTETAFSAPAQLKQSFAVVPAKLRLVALVALLRRSFVRKGSVMKTIVFISNADCVDFHFEVLTRQEKGKGTDGQGEEALETDATRFMSSGPVLNKRTGKIAQGGTIDEAKTHAPASFLSNNENDVQVFRLHGSLPQASRTSTLKAFTNTSDPAILVCTDVASRGLDLPNVDFVIEYDPPFSKDDHLHRIGRTARAGRDGRALIFLQPGNEEGYVGILKAGRRDSGNGLTRHDAS
ncbi:ATP-dependent RNA helicase dbp7, partial [Elasticomyces elasticus]